MFEKRNPHLIKHKTRSKNQNWEQILTSGAQGSQKYRWSGAERDKNPRVRALRVRWERVC